MAPGLKKGITGKTNTSGDKGAISAFSDDTTGPSSPGPAVSHPPIPKHGGIPLGKKLTPKGSI